MKPFSTTPNASPRLKLGKVEITSSAVAALTASATEGVALLHRHLHGDWGDICAQDALQNEVALLLGWRIVSRYALPYETEVWIISEGDRTLTTIMSPEATPTQLPAVDLPGATPDE